MSLEKYVTSKCFFAWKEFAVSKDYPELAKKMTLSAMDYLNIKLLVESCLDPWRMAHTKNKMKILSGKRDPDLNRAVGGANNSEHLAASACDIVCTGIDMKEVFLSILQADMPYRDLRYYVKKNFIHWSINVPGRIYKKTAEIILK